MLVDSKNVITRSEYTKVWFLSNLKENLTECF